MRKVFTGIIMLVGLTAFTQEQDLALHVSKFYNDSVYHTATFDVSSSVVDNEFANFNLATIISGNKPVKRVLGYSKKGQPIGIFYFPGTSAKKALVIGGVHGSELSSVEVARRLIEQLSTGEKPYYSVIIIPTLFPDNASTAESCQGDRAAKNIGRYSHQTAVDPNRQFPALGKPFDRQHSTDAFGRKIENENILLLQLIQAYEPERIASIHAIRDQSKAGIYADPRTDCEGRALGYSSDSALAVLMAKYIDDHKGNAFGNKIKISPTSLYYLDPKAAPMGEWQQRNLTGMNLTGKIDGVSLGSWASTAVCDEKNNYQRDAMRILTIEFPGYKKLSEYTSQHERGWYGKQVELYAGAIYNYFLQAYCVEEKPVHIKNIASR